jgi:predicted transcriptional regulator
MAVTNKENKTSLTIQISSKVANRLDDYCDVEGRIKAWVVEQSIKYFLDNNEEILKNTKSKRAENK